MTIIYSKPWRVLQVVPKTLGMWGRETSLHCREGVTSRKISCPKRGQVNTRGIETAGQSD